MEEDRVQNLQVNMAKIEANIDFIKEKLVENVDEHKDINANQREIIDKLDGFIQSSTDRFVDKKYHNETIDKISALIAAVEKDACDKKKELQGEIDKADKKYSSKWVEKILIWAGAIVGAVALVQFYNFIVRVLLTFNK